MKSNYRIRPACPADAEVLVGFTLREAQESQGIDADTEAVRRGVEGAFEVPLRARYWVVEDEAGDPVASTSVITEWSDFRGGDYWWVQAFILSQSTVAVDSLI